MATALPIDARNAVESAKPWVERLARVGYVSKAVLYFTVGALAIAAALGRGGETTDSHGAMEALFRAPFGRALLAVIALGLVGYAVWRIVAGFADSERRGHDAKGIAIRTGSVLRGLIHLALAGTAASLVVWESSKHGDPQRHWTARALETPGGVYLLWGIALGLVGYAVYQLVCAVRAKLSKQLELGRCSSSMRRVLVGISRFGLAARGIVIGTVGVLLARAAMRHDAREAGGLDDSLRELFSSLGRGPFLAIAVGVVAYAIYQLVEARFRRIRVA